MATDKIDTPAFAGEARGAFIRDILGIVLAITTALVTLAMISASRSSNWVGPYGQHVANALVFLLGQYVAWVLPAMLGALTFYTFRGAGPLPAQRFGWIRGLGGLALLVSLCAFLTLCADPGDSHQAFRFGGMLGNWLIDEQGFNLGHQLGRAGASLVFGGVAMIGAILFTDKLLREMTRMGMGLFGRALNWRRWLRRPAWLHLPQWRVFDWAAATWQWMGVCLRFAHRSWGRFISFLRGIDFERERDSRVIPIGPIIELSPRAGTGFAQPAIEEPAPAKREIWAGEPAVAEEEPAGSPAPRPLARSSRVLGGAKLEPEGSVALERSPEGPDLPGAPPAPKPARKSVQHEMDLFPGDYRLPGLSLLADPPETIYTMPPSERDELSRRIEATLAEFKIEVKVVEVVQGPVVTRFAMKVAPGVRVARILQLESELAMALRAQHVRILAPIPGQAAVGVEVPNKKANPVLLRELLESREFRGSKAPLCFALGKGISGDTTVCDLSKMPHLLIAGATGSGKSVCLNTIIASLLFRNKPDEVKFVMIDPKRVELSIYQAIPHLIAPVVSEPKKAAAALAWCVDQMEQRYKLLAEMGVRNIDGYNKIVQSVSTAKPHRKAIGRDDLKLMPHHVIIIDELADLMLVAKNEVEEYIIRLAQMARAVGMHLILATQRPSVNVITGLIKANFPSRIAFQVSSKVDSRTILDLNGAESLMGRGDMLYSPGGVKPFRIQGAFVSDAEIERLADMIREQQTAKYEKEDFEPEPTPAERAKAQLMSEALGGSVHDPNRPEMGPGDGYEGWDDDADSATADGPGPLAAKGFAGSAPLAPADMNALSDEDLYEVALRLILESRKASVSYIQRRLKIGYARAGRLMDMMEERGIVGPYQGSKPRDLRVDAESCLANLNK